MSRLPLYLVALLGIVLATNLAWAAEAGSISVETGWSRATPKGAQVAAGYVTIKNSGDEPDRLVSASADFAGETVIHQMSMAGGVMRMRPVPDGVAIPPKSTVKLEPSGYHLMFMSLTGPLKEGDDVPVKLTFEHAGSVEVTFHVLGMGAQGPESGQTRN
jgi:periplasmic copper chaperone A